MAKYLLTCACGENVVVEDAQAGGHTTCRCGKTIEIPTLRKLRDLPPAPGDVATRPQAWSVRKGVFSAAIICAVFAAMVGGYFWWTVPQPQEFDSVDRAQYVDQQLAVMTPMDGWKLWIAAYQNLGQDGFAEYQPQNISLILQAQQRHRLFYIPAFTIAILALICALVAAYLSGAKSRSRDS
jgi:phage-related minor tail protein